MEDSIKLEIGGRDPEQVERLILDQAKCNDGLAHLEPFKNLVSLSMNDASISSLDKMPALDKLTTLKLNDNKIKTGLEPLSKLTALEKLYLGGNQIPDLAALAPLVKLSRLDWLDLEGNPVQEVADYTNEVFKMMPELRVLDGYNREGEEENDADDDDEVWARSPYTSAGGRMSVGRTTSLRVRVFVCGIAECFATTVGSRTHGHVNMAAGVPTHCLVPAQSNPNARVVQDEESEEDDGKSPADERGQDSEDDEEDEDEEDGEDEDGDDDDDDDEEGEEYTDYGQILGGDEAYEEEDDDGDFAPPDQEPQDLEIAEEDDADLEAAGSMLGKRPLEDGDE